MSDFEKTPEQELQELIEVSEREAREFISRAQNLFRMHRDAGFERLDRTGAIVLCSLHEGHLMVQSSERLPNDSVILSTVELDSDQVASVNRASLPEECDSKELDIDHVDFTEESGDDSDEDTVPSPARLRSGDIAMLNEFYKHPELFISFDLDQEPEWLDVSTGG